MENKLKQVIIIRKDLKMRRGKEISQASHGCVNAVIKNQSNPLVKQWLDGVHTKICLQVNSEEELLEIYKKAQPYTIAELVTDLGLTEFNGVPTNTCVVLGPDYSNVLDQFTGDLKLL